MPIERDTAEALKRLEDKFRKRCEELEALIGSKVREEITGMLQGIQAHIESRFRNIERQLTDIAASASRAAELAARSITLADETKEYRIRRDERERIEKEERERLSFEDAHKESVWKRRAPVLALLGVVVAAIITAIGVSLASHR